MERAWMHLKKNSFRQLWKKCIRAACGIILFFVFMNGQSAQAAEEVFTEPATPQQKMIEKIEVEHKAKEASPAGVKEAAAHALVDYLPADDTPKYEVRRIQIRGNQLLTSEQILKKIPPVFDASGQYRIPAEPASLYDLRELAALADDPRMGVSEVAIEVRSAEKSFGTVMLNAKLPSATPSAAVAASDAQPTAKAVGKRAKMSSSPSGATQGKIGQSSCEAALISNATNLSLLPQL